MAYTNQELIDEFARLYRPKEIAHAPTLAKQWKDLEALFPIVVAGPNIEQFYADHGKLYRLSWQGFSAMQEARLQKGLTEILKFGIDRKRGWQRTHDIALVAAEAQAKDEVRINARKDV